MKADATTEREVLAALDRMNDAWRSRDLDALLAAFAPESEVLLVGSEQGERAQGREELARLVGYFFAEPVSYSWRWHSREVYASGRIAWLVAESTIHEVGEAGGQSVPYRITGVLERRGGEWLWLLFSGAVPDEARMDWRAIARGEESG